MEQHFEHIDFSEDYRLSGNDVIAMLCQTFGVNDYFVKSKIPQLADPGDRKYAFQKASDNTGLATSSGLGENEILLAGTGVNPILVIITPNEKDFSITTSRDHWKNLFGERH